MAEINLREADRLEVTILVDNYSDLLLGPSTEVVKRLMLPPPLAPLAEHGFSCLIKVYSGAEEHIALLDSGLGETCFFHNIDLMKVDVQRIEATILSHGHFDHFGSLKKLLEFRGGQTPIYLHPEAFLERRLNIPMVNHPTNFPLLQEAALKATGADIHLTKEPTLLASDLLLVTGEVKRLIPFEKGFPWAEAKIDGQWVYDPFNDDQAVVIKVKGQGLVVIGGCSHAGIINSVKHAQAITNTEAVLAVMGGFHLTGQLFDPIIGPTIAEMKSLNPKFVVPMHCTGWKAINQFAQQMPQQFVLNSVGTTYVFQ